jgi:MoxR-like ATPase
LPHSLRNRFIEIQFEDFPIEELAEIIRLQREPNQQFEENVFCQDHNSIVPLQISRLYHELKAHGSLHQITMRQIIKWIRRRKTLKNVSWGRIGFQLLSAAYSHSQPSECEKLLSTMVKVGLVDEAESRVLFGQWKSAEVLTPDIRPNRDNNGLVFSEGSISVEIDGMCLVPGAVLPLSIKQALFRVAMAVKHQEPILLVGDSTFKSYLMKLWWKMDARNHQAISPPRMLVNLRAETEASDLLGEIRPFTFTDLLTQIRTGSLELRERLVSLWTTSRDDFQSQPDCCEDFRELSFSLGVDVPNLVTELLGRWRQFLLQQSHNDNSDKVIETLGDNFDSILESDSDPPDNGWTAFLVEEPRKVTFIDDDEVADENTPSPGFDSNEEIQFGNEFSFSPTLNPRYEESDCDGDSIFGTSAAPATADDDIFGTSAAPATADDDIFGAIEDTQELFKLMGDLIQQPQHDSAKSRFTLPDDFLPGGSLCQLLIRCREFIYRLCNTSVRHHDEACDLMIHKLCDLVETCRKCADHPENPAFVFQDGPVTRAAKMGVPVFFEDFDAPSAAVTERLNSMLETNPSLSISEDITVSKSGLSTEPTLEDDDTTIWLLPTFQVFATLHLSQGQSLSSDVLSPATKSRFTIVHCGPYSREELQSIAQGSMKSNLPESEHPLIDDALRYIFEFRKELLSLVEFPTDIHHLFRVIEFICNHSSVDSDLKKRTILALRFFYADELDESKHSEILSKFWRRVGGGEVCPYSEYFEPLAPQQLTIPFRWDHGEVVLTYCDVRAQVHPDMTQDNLEKCLKDSKMIPTVTMLMNTSRIFAANAARAPLLLVGPPGVGKTAGVLLACSVLGFQCERINFSGNTTVDSLIGSIIPTMENGVRVFKWHAGVLVRALIEKKWILFDEINLAPPEVLDCLAPLLSREKTFSLPLSGQSIDISESRIFATMNPSSIGGNRTQLPRSVKNLFSSVLLSPFTNEELKSIFRSSCVHLVSTGILNSAMVESFFKIHLDVQRAVRERKVGVKGGPFEFNLRTLLQLTTTLEENALDRQFFLTAQSPSDENIDNNEAPDLQTLALCSLVDMIYASPFQSMEEQQFVRSLIMKEMKLAGKALDEDVSIDSSGEQFTRVGAVYLRKGSTFPTQRFHLASIYETPGMCRQMQILASAAQCSRPVLIEGDTCSAKTSLIWHLADLCNQEIVTISLNHDTETSELVGQWLPLQLKSSSHPDFHRVHELYHEVVKFLVVYVSCFLKLEPTDRHLTFSSGSIPTLSVADFSFSLFESIRKAVQVNQQNLVLESEGMDPYDPLLEIPYGWQVVCDLATMRILSNILLSCAQCDQLGNSRRTSSRLYAKCCNLVERLTLYDQEIRKMIHSSDLGSNASDTSFVFNPTPLIDAIESGKWVLFDNINSAPPEVIERLNSLFEHPPFLSLYEKSEGTIYTKADIHPNFRIFCTANVGRVHSNKISSALLNRCIRIWSPTLDHNLTHFPESRIADHDLTFLLTQKFSGLSGTRDLAGMFVSFHRLCKKLVEAKTIIPMDGFELTARTLLRAADTLVYAAQRMKDRHGTVAELACWSLLRTYSSILTDSASTIYLRKLLSSLVGNLATSTSHFDRYVAPHTSLSKAETQAREFLYPHISSIETQFGNIFFASLSFGVNLRSQMASLITQFLESYLIPLSGESTQAFSEILERSRRLTSTCESGDIDKLLRQIQETSDHNHTLQSFHIHFVVLDTTSVQKQRENIEWIQSCLHIFQASCRRIKAAIFQYLFELSVMDCSSRLAQLHRLFRVLTNLRSLVFHPILALLNGPDLKGIISQMKSELSGLENLSFLIGTVTEVDQHLSPLVSELNLSTQFCKSRGVIWAYQNESAHPLTTLATRRRMREFAGSLVSGDHSVNVPSIIKFQVASDLQGIGLQVTLLRSLPLIQHQNPTLSKRGLLFLELRAVFARVLMRFSGVFNKTSLPKDIPVDEISNQIMLEQHEIQRAEILFSTYRDRLEGFLENIPTAAQEGNVDGDNDFPPLPSLARIPSSTSHQLEELLSTISSAVREYSDRVVSGSPLALPNLRKHLKSNVSEARRGLSNMNTSLEQRKAVLLNLVEERDRTLMEISLVTHEFVDRLTRLDGELQAISDGPDFQLLATSSSQILIFREQQFLQGLTNSRYRGNQRPRHSLSIPVPSAISLTREYMNSCRDTDPYATVDSLMLVKNKLSLTWMIPLLYSENRDQSFHLLSSMNVIEATLTLCSNPDSLHQRTSIFVYDPQCDTLSGVVLDRLEDHSSFSYFWIADGPDMLPWQKRLLEFVQDFGGGQSSRIFLSLDAFPHQGLENQSHLASFILTIVSMTLLPYSDDDIDFTPTHIDDIKQICLTSLGAVEGVCLDINRLLGSISGNNIDSDQEVLSVISSTVSLLNETQRVVKESITTLSLTKVTALLESDPYQQLSIQKITNNTMLQSGKKRLIDQCQQSVFELFALYSLISASGKEWPVGKEIFQSCQVTNIADQLSLRRQFHDISYATAKVMAFFRKYLHQKMKDPNEVSRLWLSHHELVDFLESLVSDLLVRTVRIVGDKIELDHPRSQEWFQSKQAALNILIQNLQIPNQVVRSIQLDKVFENLEISITDSPQTQPVSVSSEVVSANPKQTSNPIFVALQNICHRVELIMTQARLIKPLPNAILVDLRTFLVRIKSAQLTCDIDLIQLRHYEREPAKYERLLQEYAAMLAEKDPFLAKIKYLTKQKQFGKIPPDILAVAPDCDTDVEALSMSEITNIGKLIFPLKHIVDETSMSGSDHKNLKLLVTGGTKVSSWKLLVQLSRLLYSVLVGEPENQTVLQISDQIAALLVTNYDSLSLTIETLGFRQLCKDATEGKPESRDTLIPMIKELVIPNVVRHYCEHRQLLLFDPESSLLMNNFSLIQKECRLGRHLIASRNPSLANLFPLLSLLHSRSQCLLQELRCCLKGTSCLFLPISFELTDLIAIFTPSRTVGFEIVEHIVDSLTEALQAGNAPTLANWKPNTYSLGQIPLTDELFPTEETRSFDLFMIPTLFDQQFCQQFLKKVSNCYKTIFTALQGFFFSSSERVSNIWSRLDDCFPLQLAMGLSVLYLVDTVIEHVVENDTVLPRLSVNKHRIDDEEYRNKMNELQRRLENFRISLRAKLEEKSSVENSQHMTSQEKKTYEFRMNQTSTMGQYHMYADQARMCRLSLHRFALKLSEIEETILSLQQEIRNGEIELQTLQNNHENERLSQVVKVRGDINDILKLLSEFCNAVLRYLEKAMQGQSSTSFSGDFAGRFETHVGGGDDERTLHEEQTHDTREGPLEVVNIFLENLLKSCLKPDLAANILPSNYFELDESLRSIRLILKKIRQNIVEDDPLNRVLHWADSLVSTTFSSILSFSSHWVPYRNFVSRSSHSPVNWTKKLSSLSQDIGENVVLLESSIRSRGNFSQIADRDIPHLLGYLDQIYDLCPFIGIDQADGLFMSFNSTAAFLAAVIMCCAQLLRIQSHGVNLKSIEREVKLKMKRLGGISNNTSAHLLDVDLLTNSFDEGELNQRFSLLMIFLPSVVTSFTHFVTHGAFHYLTSPFTLVEEIQGTLEYYTRSCLAPSYLCHRMIESFVSITPIIFTHAVQESLSAPQVLPKVGVVDQDPVLLYDRRHPHALIKVTTQNCAQICSFCRREITEPNVACCLSPSCNSVFHLYCLNRENIVDEKVTKTELAIYQRLLSTFCKIANSPLTPDLDSSVHTKCFAFSSILLRSENDSCLASDLDHFVTHSSDFLAILSHRRPKLEPILTELDRSIDLLRREITISSVQSLCDHWSDWVHLKSESSSDLNTQILLIENQPNLNSNFSIDLNQLTLVDVFQMDNLLQRFYREVLRCGVEGANTMSIFRPTEKYQLLANLVFHSFHDEGQILQTLVSCAPHSFGLEELLRKYISHFSRSQSLMTKSLLEIANSRDPLVLSHEILNFEDRSFLDLVDRMMETLSDPLNSFGDSLSETATKAALINENWTIQCNEFLTKRNDIRKSQFQHLQEAAARYWNEFTTRKENLEMKYQRDLETYTSTCQKVNEEVESLLNAIKYCSVVNPSTSRENITILQDLRQVVANGARETQRAIHPFDLRDQQLELVPIVSNFLMKTDLVIPSEVRSEIKIRFQVENGKARSHYFIRGDTVVHDLHRSEKQLDNFDIENWNFDSCVIQIVRNTSWEQEVLEEQRKPLREMHRSGVVGMNTIFEFALGLISIRVVPLNFQLGWAPNPAYSITEELYELGDLRTRLNQIKSKLRYLNVPKKSVISPDTKIKSPDSLVDGSNDAFARDKSEIQEIPATKVLKGLAAHHHSLSSEVLLLKSALGSVISTAKSQRSQDSLRKVWDQIKVSCDTKSSQLCDKCDHVIRELRDLMNLARSVIQRVLSEAEVSSTVETKVHLICTRGMQSCFNRLREVGLIVTQKFLDEDMIKLLQLATWILCLMAANIRYDSDMALFPSTEEIKFVYENLSRRVQSTNTQSKISIEKLRASIERILQFKRKKLDELRKARLLSQPPKKLSTPTMSPLEMVQLSKQATLLVTPSSSPTQQVCVQQRTLRLDFGTLIMSDDYSYRTLHIINRSEIFLDARISLPEYSNGEKAFEIMYRNSALVLQPFSSNSFSELEIRLNQSLSGKKEETFQIEIDHQSVTVELFATIQTVDFEVEIEELNFGQVLFYPGLSLQKGFQITNRTDISLLVKGRIKPDHFRDASLKLPLESIPLLPRSTCEVPVCLTLADDPSVYNTLSRLSGTIELYVGYSSSNLKQVVIPLQAQFVKPSFQLSIPSHNLDNLEHLAQLPILETTPNAPVSLRLRLQNTAIVPLSVNWSCDHPAIAISNSSAQLEQKELPSWHTLTLHSPHALDADVLIKLKVLGRRDLVAFRLRVKCGTSRLTSLPQDGVVFHVDASSQLIPERVVPLKGRSLRFHNTGNICATLSLVANDRITSDRPFVIVPPNDIGEFPVSYEVSSLSDPSEGEFYIKVGTSPPQYLAIKYTIIIARYQLFVSPHSAINMGDVPRHIGNQTIDCTFKLKPLANRKTQMPGHKYIVHLPPSKPSEVNRLKEVSFEIRCGNYVCHSQGKSFLEHTLQSNQEAVLTIRLTPGSALGSFSRVVRIDSKQEFSFAVSHKKQVHREIVPQSIFLTIFGKIVDGPMQIGAIPRAIIPSFSFLKDDLQAEDWKALFRHSFDSLTVDTAMTAGLMVQKLCCGGEGDRIDLSLLRNDASQRIGHHSTLDIDKGKLLLNCVADVFLQSNQSLGPDDLEFVQGVAFCLSCLDATDGSVDDYQLFASLVGNMMPSCQQATLLRSEIGNIMKECIRLRPLLLSEPEKLLVALDLVVQSTSRSIEIYGMVAPIATYIRNIFGKAKLTIRQFGLTISQQWKFESQSPELTESTKASIICLCDAIETKSLSDIANSLLWLGLREEDRSFLFKAVQGDTPGLFGLISSVLGRTALPPPINEYFLTLFEFSKYLSGGEASPQLMNDVVRVPFESLGLSKEGKSFQKMLCPPDNGNLGECLADILTLFPPEAENFQFVLSLGALLRGPISRGNPLQDSDLSSLFLHWNRVLDNQLKDWFERFALCVRSGDRLKSVKFLRTLFSNARLCEPYDSTFKFLMELISDQSTGQLSIEQTYVASLRLLSLRHPDLSNLLCSLNNFLNQQTIPNASALIRLTAVVFEAPTITNMLDITLDTLRMAQPSTLFGSVSRKAWHQIISTLLDSSVCSQYVNFYEGLLTLELSSITTPNLINNVANISQLLPLAPLIERVFKYYLSYLSLRDCLARGEMIQEAAYEFLDSLSDNFSTLAQISVYSSSFVRSMKAIVGLLTLGGPLNSMVLVLSLAGGLKGLFSLSSPATASASPSRQLISSAEFAQGVAPSMKSYLMVFAPADPPDFRECKLFVDESQFEWEEEKTGDSHFPSSPMDPRSLISEKISPDAASLSPLSSEIITVLNEEIKRIHANTVTLQQQVSKIEMTFSLAVPVTSGKLPTPLD